MASLAIEVGIAFLADGALSASGATAINVGFLSILAMVDTLVRYADVGQSIASIAGAIGIEVVTTHADSASRAYTATAIHSRLIAVLAMVYALVRNARVGVSVAGVA